VQVADFQPGDRLKEHKYSFLLEQQKVWKSKAPHTNKDSSPLFVFRRNFICRLNRPTCTTSNIYTDKTDLDTDCLTQRCRNDFRFLSSTDGKRHITWPLVETQLHTPFYGETMTRHIFTHTEFSASFRKFRDLTKAKNMAILISSRAILLRFEKTHGSTGLQHVLSRFPLIQIQIQAVQNQNSTQEARRTLKW
jgi:hypothetical protein